jgi:hypothetical protein
MVKFTPKQLTWWLVGLVLLFLSFAVGVAVAAFFEFRTGLIVSQYGAMWVALRYALKGPGYKVITVLAIFVIFGLFIYFVLCRFAPPSMF